MYHLAPIWWFCRMNDNPIHTHTYTHIGSGNQNLDQNQGKKKKLKWIKLSVDSISIRTWLCDVFVPSIRWKLPRERESVREIVHLCESIHLQSQTHVHALTSSSQSLIDGSSINTASDGIDYKIDTCIESFDVVMQRIYTHICRTFVSSLRFGNVLAVSNCSFFYHTVVNVSQKLNF